MNAQLRSTSSRMLLLGLVLAAMSAVSPTSLRADSDDPPERVARLGALQGTVSIEPSGVNTWSAASPNYPIATGDRVYTDEDGRTEVQVGQTVARMWHGTDLTVTNLTDDMIQLGLAQGTIRLRTYGHDSRAQVEIDTPNGALTITRPGDVRVDSYPGEGGTVVTVNNGEVELTGPGLSERLGRGQSLRMVGTNPIELANLEMPRVDEFDSWSLDRDRHMQRSNSARYVSREAPGFDDLDDYGDWSPQTEYGPVWYPRNVSADWVPYRYGHWVWTGPWGWTWVEDEPWGYAPFHYGRWANIDNRWGWIPGPVAVRPVWSPALVAFVGGPHFGMGIAVGGGAGVSAWFPLGPGEPYTPWYHCSPRYVNQVNITNIHVTRIVNVQNNYNTVNVTNVNYVHRIVATTAVSGQNFSSARPVATNRIHLDPRQLEQAQVIPHPDIRPTVQSVVSRPVSNLRVPATRPTLLTQGGHEAPAVPGARLQSVPYKPLPANAMQHVDTLHPVAGGNASADAHPGTAMAPALAPVQAPVLAPVQAPVQAPARGSYHSGTSQPPTNQGGKMQNAPRQPVITHQPGGASQPLQAPVNSHAPQQFGGQTPAQNQPPRAMPAPQTAPVQGNSDQGQRPLVYRNETPAQRPTFQQEQPAMKQHPGRPLEPQQIENIRQGHPAGAQQDHELIPHAQPQPRYQAPAQVQQQQIQPRYTAPPQQAQPHSQPQQMQHTPANEHHDHNDSH